MGAALGSWQSSGTASLAFGAISAGANRGLVIWVNQEVGSPSALTVTYGDQTATLIGQVNVGDSTDNHLAGYFVTESQIAAASGTTITAASAPTSTSIAARAYEEVEQNTTTIQATFDSAAQTGDSDPLTGISASAAAGDVSVGGGGTGNGSGGDASWAGTNPMSHGITDDASSSCVTAGDRISSGSETVNHSVTYVTAPNRVTGAMFVLANNPDAGITSVTPDEFDYDEADIDVAGANFGASQGSATVYISDASTLAGSANEVDITNAVQTWADDNVNLDLTALTTELDDLHTLGPGARYVIVLTDASDEYSYAVTAHRPQAFEMVLGSATPGSTTQRLSGLTGSFAGGRIEETAAQNPSTTNTDVATDGNREDAWSLRADAASREVSYDFRVLYGGNVANTITVTPQVTVVSAGGDVEVSASVDALTLSEQQSAVALDVGILASVVELGIAENATDIDLDKAIDATTTALSVVEYQASVNRALNLQPEVTSITISSGNAGVSLGITIAAPSTALTIAESAATLQLSKNVDATLATLTIAEQAAIVGIATEILASVVELGIVGNGASVSLDIDVQATLVALGIDENASAIEVSKAIDASSVSLAIDEWAPGVSANRDVVATLSQLTITEAAASVGLGTVISATLTELGVTSYAPTVLANVDIQATLASLGITEQSSSIAVSKAIEALVVELSVVEHGAIVQAEVSVGGKHIGGFGFGFKFGW